MLSSLNRALLQSGYREMISTEEHRGYRIYYDMMKSLVNAVLFVDADVYSAEFVKNFRDSMSERMSEYGYQTHYMTIVCVNSGSSDYYAQTAVARQVCSDNPFVWVYDDGKKELEISEEQAEDFYGLKGVLEKAKYIEDDDTEEKTENKAYADSLRMPKRKRINVPPVTASLVFLNVVVFIICTFTGNLLYNIGAAGLDVVVNEHQYYRVFSSMFLHADISHIFGNMVLLYFLGDMVERKMPKTVYFLIYIISGICGTVANFINEMIFEEYSLVIGASGAIFGILGVLLSLAMFKRVSGKNLSVGRILVVIVFSLYDGFFSPGVAVWAHVGGLLAGLVLGLIYCIVTEKISKGILDED